MHTFFWSHFAASSLLRLDFFESDSTFKYMSKEEKSILSTSCSVQNFAAGEVILREGEVGEWMFIVIEGTVKIVDQFLGEALWSQFHLCCTKQYSINISPADAAPIAGINT